MDNGHCGRLHNKVAVVTGSSSGIGRAIALRFSSEGAHVVCADTDSTTDSDSDSADDATHNVILKSGSSALFVNTNVGCSQEVEDLVRTTVSHYGRLDIFVNNAGITFDLETLQPIWSADEGLWDDIQQVCSKGVFLGWISSQMTSEVLNDEETQEHIISLHPFRGLGIPDDIARAAVFLASEDSSWITGVALPVDGGYTAR
ncbi:hypothetical protein QM012_002011 [Aureobasidium pullulans]|uniref:3-oxoacyl-[acyl-carrier-protein] reductase n=1 Tax=Aureobasidium pullulans TaxID=5580 RepID=A0ABR0TD59_AURPU